jgi:phage tail-like protein
MPSREQPPLLGTAHFRVLIGRRELGFSEVGPLTSGTAPEDAYDGREPGFAPIVLRRALTQSTELYDWRRNVAAGKADRRTVTIHQLDAAGGAIVNSWRLEGAWPRRWSGPSFDARGNDVAMEEIELCFADLVWLEPNTEKQGGRSVRAT